MFIPRGHELGLLDSVAGVGAAQPLPEPDLCLISPALLAAVDARLAERSALYLRDHRGKLLGAPKANGHKPVRYLLAGMIECDCGGMFEAVRGYYVCSTRRRKGRDVCPSDFSFSVEAIDNGFLSVLEDEILSPTLIDRVLDSAFSFQPEDERAMWLAERQRLATEITNLTNAVATGGDIPALVARLQERDRALKDLDVKLAQPLNAPDRDMLRAALELRTADWRDILRGPHVAQARMVLKHLLDLPIRVMNQPKPKWLASARPEGLATGLVHLGTSPPGFEPGFQP